MMATPGLVVTNDDSVGDLLGNGDGTFQTNVDYVTGSFRTFLYIL